MTVAETTIEHIEHELTAIKADLREMRASVDDRFRELAGSMRMEFRLLWAAFFGLAGILAKGFHWF